ncbi:MAG: hypothetical protein ABIJ96_18780 [Elusimicrobiota bacterium]
MRMNKVMSLSMALALGLAAAAAAAEKETPKAPVVEKEMPKAPAAVKETPKAPVAVKFDAALKKALQDAVDKHVRTQAKSGGGLYPFYDDESEETMPLMFSKFAAEDPMKVHDATYIVRAAFISRGDPGFGEKDEDVLADFTLTQTKGAWEITDEVIYSYGGMARFSYTKEFRRIRVGAHDEGESEVAAPEEEDAPIGGEEEFQTPVEKDFEETDDL